MAPTIQDRIALLAECPPEVDAEISAETAENLTIAQATDLLDWLEGHNIRATDVRLDQSGRMTVTWNNG